MKIFGEPAPRNFDKEVPGPNWRISEETEKALETVENQQSIANHRLRRLWLLHSVLV